MRVKLKPNSDMWIGTEPTAIALKVSYARVFNSRQAALNELEKYQQPGMCFSDAVLEDC